MLRKKFIIPIILLLSSISTFPIFGNSNNKNNNGLNLPETESPWTFPAHEILRREIIRDMLTLCEKSMDEDLITELVKLTDGYTPVPIKNLIAYAAEDSPGTRIDRKICLNLLIKTIQHAEDADPTRRVMKLKHVNKLIKEEIQRSKQKEASKPTPACPTPVTEPLKAKYPLLKDVYHTNKMCFEDAVKQLKKGHLESHFPRGFLFYGPPGVGKGDMANAIANESNADIFRINAPKLIDIYQGSGAQAINSVFLEAKENKKASIVFIDELQSLAKEGEDSSSSSDKKTHQGYQGQDYKNTLAQIWTEYDDCLKNYDHILIIATCNDFKCIDKRICERFECTEFPLPDKKGTREILKNKAQHFGVPLSESHLDAYTYKMSDMSGRKLNNFIKKTKLYLNRNVSLHPALEQSLKDQKKATDDNEQSTMSKVWGYTKSAGKAGVKAVGYGACLAIGATLVARATTPESIAMGKQLIKNVFLEKPLTPQDVLLGSRGKITAAMATAAAPVVTVAAITNKLTSTSNPALTTLTKTESKTNTKPACAPAA